MSVVLIPTLNPEVKLLDYINELKNSGFKNVIIVNDGSEQNTQYIFDEILKLEDRQFEVTILNHVVNLGKGRALKNGINYYLAHLKDKYQGCCGLITVDSDGQHLIKDVQQLKQRLEKIYLGGGIILGCRDFCQENVPFKSRYGNNITKVVFRLFFGRNISDTQTGLRAFSNKSLFQLIDLYGERFEYETNVLIACVDQGIPIEELTIETIYENGNKSTHFNPIKDSIKIYRLLLARFLRYIVASFSASIVDLMIFVLLCSSISEENTLRIYIATIGARVISSIYNYIINKNVVFQYKKESFRTATQYFILCILVMFVSGFCVNSLYRILGHFELLIKCIVDGILFCCNYFIQQKIIFRRNF